MTKKHTLTPTLGGKREGAGRPKELQEARKTVCVELLESQAEKITELAKAEGISKSAKLREIVDFYLGR